MATGRSNFQRSLGSKLTADVRQVAHRPRLRAQRRWQRWPGPFALQTCTQVQQLRTGADPEFGEQADFIDGVRSDQQPPAGRQTGTGCRQQSGYAAHTPVQPQFCHALELFRGKFNGPGCLQNAQSDGKVKAASLLGQVRRSQIDGDPRGRNREPAALQGCAHTITGLTHGGFREPDNGHPGQPTCNVHFHTHQRGLHADSGTTVNGRQTCHGVEAADESKDMHGITENRGCGGQLG